MAFDRRHGLLAIPMHHAQFSLHRISINGLNSLSSVFCQPSSDNLFQAALALASRSWLSPPESIFLPAEGRFQAGRWSAIFFALASNGSSRQKREPSPGVLLTSTLPPWRLATTSTRASPRPAPRCCRPDVTRPLRCGTLETASR